MIVWFEFMAVHFQNLAVLLPDRSAHLLLTYGFLMFSGAAPGCSPTPNPPTPAALEAEWEALCVHNSCHFMLFTLVVFVSGRILLLTWILFSYLLIAPYFFNSSTCARSTT